MLLLMPFHGNLFFHLTNNDLNLDSDSDSIHSSPSSPENTSILRTTHPLNFYKNQSS